MNTYFRIPPDSSEFSLVDMGGNHELFQCPGSDIELPPTGVRFAQYLTESKIMIFDDKLEVVNCVRFELQGMLYFALLVLFSFMLDNNKDAFRDQDPEVARLFANSPPAAAVALASTYFAEGSLVSKADVVLSPEEQSKIKKDSAATSKLRSFPSKGEIVPVRMFDEQAIVQPSRASLLTSVISGEHSGKSKKNGNSTAVTIYLPSRYDDDLLRLFNNNWLQ